MSVVKTEDAFDLKIQEKRRPTAGLYYVIPAFVMECDQLEHSEIVFYALVSGLAINKGYCFASDEYLAERMGVDERTVQKWLCKIEKLGFLERHTEKHGMSWSRKIYVNPNVSNNVYEGPSRAGSNRPPGRDRTDPQGDIVGKAILEGKEELFCIPKAVASDSEKISSVQEKKKEALELAQESLKMPGTITKPTPDGKSITTTLNDVFAESLRRRSDWMTKEIHDAWKIYAEYQGAIRDPLRFIEGTIKNLRNEKKVNYLKKQGKICTNDQLMTSTNSKENSSAKDTKEQFSLSAILAMEAKTQKKIVEWMKHGKNFLVVMGPPGVGKTYFCAALIEWVCKKCLHFRYWHERELFTRLRGLIRDNSGEWSREIEYVLDDEFVMYDDLGCSGFNEWRKEVILSMVDIRYESTKPTVITTNLSKKSIYENLGSRTYSRMFDKSNLIIDMSEMPDKRQI